MNKTKRIALQGIVLTMDAVEEDLKGSVWKDERMELVRIIKMLAEAYSIIERGKRYDPNT